MRASLFIGLIGLLSLASCADDQPDASKAPAFEDVRWVVAAGSPRPTATFSEGRVTGFDGCNRYSASYASDGESLTIGKLAATRIACRSGADELARNYRASLDRVARLRLEDGRLVLLDARGTSVLRYVEGAGGVG